MPTDITNQLSFYLLDGNGKIVDQLIPGEEYCEMWIWDVLRIAAKGSDGITLHIQDCDFTAVVDEHWTLALKSLGQSPAAVRLIRKVVEEHVPFEEAEAAILKEVL